MLRVHPRAGILIVEDDVDTRELVCVLFEQAGYAVRHADTGEEALASIAAERPALVLLGLGPPGADSLQVCRRIRANAAMRDVPVIMLTAKATEVDRVLGLEMGADDYITKPFSPRELLARVQAVRKRSARARELPVPETFTRGRLAIEFDTYEVRIDGKVAELSLREFEILRFFVRHPNRVYDRAQLLDLIWGSDTHVRTRTIDVHIGHLRKYLERNESAPEIVVTVRGVGYKFVARALDA